MDKELEKLAQDVRVAVEAVRPLPEGANIHASWWLGGSTEDWDEPVYVSVWPGDDGGVEVEGFYDAVCDMASDSYEEQVAWLAEQILQG